MSRQDNIEPQVVEDLSLQNEEESDFEGEVKNSSIGSVENLDWNFTEPQGGYFHVFNEEVNFFDPNPEDFDSDTDSGFEWFSTIDENNNEVLISPR